MSDAASTQQVQELIDRAQELLAAATPGPWLHGYDDGSGKIGEDGGDGGTITCTGYVEVKPEVLEDNVVTGGKDSWGSAVGVLREGDAAFIAAAPELVSNLTDTLAALLRERAERDARTQDLRRLFLRVGRFVRHLPTCRIGDDRGTSPQPISPCTCGLDELISEWDLWNGWATTPESESTTGGDA